MNNVKKTKYPIYVISKGRWVSRYTVKTLDYIGAKYQVVVEQKEYDNYASVISEDKLIKVDNFSELGQGSIPVRNFVWEHSINSGHKKHWVLDDNIESIERYNYNRKIKCKTIAPFIACEDFTDRYENVKLSGMNYAFFCPIRDARPPFKLNTRIYSCILIDNSINHRWRGKYNEDTDLSLRVLKDGYCTILFNEFLICKLTTMKIKGGNTDTIYNTSDNRLEFAKSLEKQHPDVVNVSWKFGRWHHNVNYRPFKKNILIRKKNIYISNKINEFGMVLKKQRRTK